MDTFTVHIDSGECADSCAENKSFRFANPFPFKCGDMTSYEVALAGLSYYDEFKVQKLVDPFDPGEKSGEFFDITKEENNVTAERWQRNTIKLTKTRDNFGSFVTDIQRICREGGINVDFTQRRSRGIITNIILKFEFEERLILSQRIANILGFNDTVFTKGEYISPKAPDLVLFGTLNIGQALGPIAKEKFTKVTVQLAQVTGYPLISSLLTDIVLKLAAVNFVVSLRVRNTSRSIEWNNPGIKITLSPFLTKYLHLNEGFGFYQKSSIHIPPVVPKISKIVVLCNIIRNQVYIGKEKKVLAVLDRQESDTIKKHIYQPNILLYNDVVMPHINQIHLSLLTDKNTYLTHSKFPTTATLHFRRKLFE